MKTAVGKGKGNLLKRLVAGTAIAALAGLSAATAGIVVTKYSSVQYFGPPQPAAQAAVAEGQMEQGNTDTGALEKFLQTADLSRYFPRASNYALKDLQATGVDAEREVSRAEIQQMIDQTMPYLAQALGIDQLYMPPLTMAITDDSFFYGLGVNMPPTKALYAKETAAHEYAHAQWLGRSFAPWNLPRRIAEIIFRHSDRFANPLNETDATVTEFEVLADQALDGDPLARAAFLNDIEYAFNIKQRADAGEKLSKHDVMYAQKPATIALEALKGKRTSYHGIKLDGLTELLRREIDQAVSPIPPNATLYDLTEYCTSPEAKLVCGPQVMDVYVVADRGTSYDEKGIGVSYLAASNSSLSSQEIIEQNGKPAFLRSNLVFTGFNELLFTISIGSIDGPAMIILKDANPKEGDGVIIEAQVNQTHSNGRFYIIKTGDLIPTHNGSLASIVKEMEYSSK